MSCLKHWNWSRRVPSCILFLMMMEGGGGVARRQQIVMAMEMLSALTTDLKAN